MLAALVAGCRVQTNVALTQQPNGTGMVQVSVVLDPSAVAAVGGRAALAAQLQDGDLVAAGWTVSGPVAGPGSTTVVTASHPFVGPEQAGALIADLAGTGPASSRPFRLAVTRHSSLWRTTTTLSGQVDLTCGLGCFGDSGLAAATGSDVGVDAGALAKQARQAPGQVFGFGVSARLPGSVVRTNAAGHAGGTLEWTPELGRSIQLSAVTQSWQWGHVIAASVAGGLVLVGMAVGGAWWWRRRRHRRRQGRARHAAPAGANARPAGAAGPPGAGEAVTPGS
jgi:hypothetical protein